MSDKRRRSTFRHHLVLTSAVSTAAFATLVGASLFIPLVAQLDRPDLDHQTAGGIAEHILYLHRSFWPVVLGSLLASVASGLLLYERMSGPLVRFLGVFRRISRGEIPDKITLRRVDYLVEEAAGLNEMIEALAERATERGASLARCQDLLADLEAFARDHSPQECRVLDQLREALKAVR